MPPAAALAFGQGVDHMVARQGRGHDQRLGVRWFFGLTRDAAHARILNQPQGLRIIAAL